MVRKLHGPFTVNLIYLTDVDYQYSQRYTPVLRSVSLSVTKQSLVAVIGASGSGKSTLLRLIAGLFRPTRGEVWLAGRFASEISPRERRVGFVFQNLALFPNLDAAGNIAFGLRYSNLSPSEQRHRLTEIVTSLELSDCIKRRPRELSGGQAQRVALARALAPGPEILLLDEPFSSLDRPLADAARALVVKLHRELCLTTVLVTHDREQALSIADRIVVLGRGTIEQVSTAEDVYENPATIEVAKLTGALNLVPGHILDSDKHLVVVQVNGTKLEARWMSQDIALPGTPVQIAFRPEWAHLSSDLSASSAPNSLEAAVTQVVVSGARRHVHCICGPSQVFIEARDTESVAVGQQVRIFPLRDKALAYPTKEK